MLNKHLKEIERLQALLAAMTQDRDEWKRRYRQLLTPNSVPKQNREKVE